MSDSNETKLRAALVETLAVVADTARTMSAPTVIEGFNRVIKRAEDALAAPSIGTSGDQAPSDAAEPVAWFAFGDSNGPVPLELYGWDEKACKNAVLTFARAGNYKGTVEGYLMQMGWTLHPVYLAAPQLVERKAQCVSRNGAVVASDARANSSYAAGLLAGWNFCDADDHAGYAHAREHYFASAATLRTESRSASQAHGKSGTVAAATPCGGCGNANPDERCIGCGHVFGGAQRPTADPAAETAVVALRAGCERQRAIMEAERNASLENWMAGRGCGTTATEAGLYETGYTNGWDRRAALAAASPAPAEPNSGFPAPVIQGEVPRTLAAAWERISGLETALTLARKSLDFRQKRIAELSAATAGQQPVAVPDGFMLLPKRITNEMIESAIAAHYGKRLTTQCGGAIGVAFTVAGRDWNGVQAMRRIWAGALAAAPDVAAIGEGDSKDAARYRWLRNWIVSPKPFAGVGLSGICLDVRIDATLAQQAAPAAEGGEQL